MDHYGVRPDILVFAKGIASGLPLSGIAASKELMDSQPPGSMGGTYAGNAVSCAAAVATIGAIESDGMLRNCREMGEQLVEGLEDMREEGLPIAEVRGLGLMVGCEFAPSAGGIAADVSQACLKSGLLLLQAGCHDTVRFLPPLNVSANDVSKGLQLFEDAVHEVMDVRRV